MGEICDCCGRPQWSNEGVQRAGECARLVGGAWHVHYSEDCYRLGYEREKAARASLEARLATAEADRDAAESRKSEAFRSLKDKATALEQQVVELREALHDAFDTLMSVRISTARDERQPILELVRRVRAALANHQPEKKK